MSNHGVRQCQSHLKWDSLRDIMIPVIGVVGAGKSTFINLILDNVSMDVNGPNDLRSCTSSVAEALIPPSRLTEYPWFERRRVFLVDTPGFNDADRSDGDTFQLIDQWVEDSRRYSVAGGAIYLMDGSLARFNDADMTCFKYFMKLFGSPMEAKLNIGLTKMHGMTQDELAYRQTSLKKQLWKLTDKNVCFYIIPESTSLGQALDVLTAVLSGYYPLDVDIVVPVLGGTGSGISTFINSILGEDRMKVGHGQESCTKKTQASVVRIDSLNLPSNHLEKHRLVLVDTPGFNNIEISDWDNLQQIVGDLKTAYPEHLLLGGMIYLQSLDCPVDKRIKLISRVVSDALKGVNVFKYLVLGATKLDKFEDSQGQDRLKNIENDPWKGIIRMGARAFGIRQGSQIPVDERSLQSRVLLKALLVDLKEGNGEVNINNKDGSENPWAVLWRFISSIIH